MSTITIAAILIGALTGICLLLISISKKQKLKKMNQLLNLFRKLGTAYNLSFSGYETFNNNIIGLDGINRKLLVLHQIDKVSFNDYVVNLDEVKICTVKKHYGQIKPGELKNQKLETYLESMVLHFELNNGKDPIEIVFYNHIENNIYHLSEAEQKAEHWKQLLTKMLKGSLIKTA